jgi:hypothetical protein
MAIDPNRKTLRHFYCNDGLWQLFEQLSEAVDRGVDELVNEAMRVYAEQAGYFAGADTDAQPAGVYQPEPSRPPAVPPPLPAARRTSHYAGRPSLPPAQPVMVPPPLPGGASAPPLYLIFGNQKYIVDKEQFIIGRGAKTSDLPIRDGNISRKHAAVVRRGGVYYIKDLGSTNGIDYNGERIEARKIEEGDVYSICDYQLKFTFR